MSGRTLPKIHPDYLERLPVKGFLASVLGEVHAKILVDQAYEDIAGGDWNRVFTKEKEVDSGSR